MTWRLLLHAYGFLGFLEALCASAMGFWYLERKGIHFSDIWLAYGKLPEGIDGALLSALTFFYAAELTW